MASVAVPNILTDPGVLYASVIGGADPVPTIAGGVITDDPDPTWIPLGATEAGSTFSYASTVEAITVAEFFDPIKYGTTGRSGSIAFNLADYTLKNYKLALNGGVGALAPVSGSGDTALYSFEPPDPGEEIRVAILWQSTDNTMRLVLRQTIQGGEVTSAYAKAPAYAVIPCTFNMEVPVGGAKPFKFWSSRG